MAAKVIILSLLCFAVIQGQRDLTLVPNASGSDVVKAVVSKIETAGLFPTDHRLLRRIAYVQSLDGEETRTFRDGYHGGIWQVNRATLVDTQNLSAHPELVSLYDKVQVYFDIDWRYVTWEDLRMPFYSGLAARIYLSNLGGIPLAGDIDGQATYWRAMYNNGTEKDFVTLVNALEQKEDCNIDVDLIFVLDSSGSVGRSDYQRVREFVKNFIMSISIGQDEDQVGVIIFSSDAQVVFNLNTYQNQAQLLSAISSIPYISGSTNTAAALRQLIDEGFTEGGGARLDSKTVLRIAIVMTDGKSNVNAGDTPIAAERVHDFRPSILVYAVGVTSSVNQDELNEIATSPDFIENLESFDDSLLKEYQEERSYEICFKASSPADVGEELNGTLDQGEQARFQLDIPVTGITIHLRIEAGRVVLYASTKIPNPNAAYYDWKLECLIGCDFFVDPRDLDIVQVPVDDVQQKHQVNESSNDTNFTLYLVTEGEEENTTFMIETTVGDTSTPKACEPACTCTNSTELQRLTEAMERLEKRSTRLHTTTNEIYTLLKQQNEEMKLKFIEVSEKLNNAQEDIRTLQDSNDDLIRRHYYNNRDDTMEMTSTEQGLSSMNPCMRQAERSSPSGFYWTRNAVGHPVPVYCDMNRTCCGESGAWMRIAHINMTDPAHSCPSGFSVVETAPRRCYSSSSGCRSVIFPLHGIEYQRVCGRIIGYQYGYLGAFHGGTHSIDEAYVDGISVTHGGPSCNRKHVWTFAAAADEVYSDSNRCPCSRTNRLFTGRVPEYVKDDYFCDSGSRATADTRTFYGEDPLWDGSGCGIRSACCRFNIPPWFCREFLEPITDNIEVRVCHDSRYENVYFELIELYVK